MRLPPRKHFRVSNDAIVQILPSMFDAEHSNRSHVKMNARDIAFSYSVS